MTRDKALNLANLWVAAWNAHDLDWIMEHYADAIELTSPISARIGGRRARTGQIFTLRSLFVPRQAPSPLLNGLHRAT